MGVGVEVVVGGGCGCGCGWSGLGVDWGIGHQSSGVGHRLCVVGVGLVRLWGIGCRASGRVEYRVGQSRVESGRVGSDQVGWGRVV